MYGTIDMNSYDVCRMSNSESTLPKIVLASEATKATATAEFVL